MAENRPITPEKQLLKLIEGSDKGPVTKAVLLSPASIGSAFVGGFAFLRRLVSGKGGRKALSLAPLNKGLTAAVAAFVLYILADSLVSGVRLLRPAALDLKGEKSISAPIPISSQLGDEASYTGKFSARDIFNAGAVAPADSGAPAQPDPNAAVANLSLVGIAWSAKPEAIIEDNSKQRTFFLREGQTLPDGVTVKKVLKDHIVLSHNGQEFELR